MVEINFRQFLEQNTVGRHNDSAYGSFLGSDWTGSETQDQLLGHPPYLFGTDLVPTITRRSPLVYLQRNKNPIFMQLADGTKMHLTWDEYRRIFPREEPVTGQEITVVFQRFPGDQSEQASQIQSIKLGAKPPKSS